MAVDRRESKKPRLSKSSNLDARRLAYSSMAGALLAGTAAAQPGTCAGGVQTGPICHTDIPDTSLNADGDSLRIDFDGDGDYELIVEFSSYYSTTLYSYLVEIGDVFADPTADRALSHLAGFTSATRGPDASHPGALLSTDTVGATGMQTFAVRRRLGFWSSTLGGTTSSGNFIGKGDRFVGVRFQLDNATQHFGWIRVSVPNRAVAIIIRDYAYDTRADTPIGVGVTTPVQLQSFSIE